MGATGWGQAMGRLDQCMLAVTPEPTAQGGGLQVSWTCCPALETTGHWHEHSLAHGPSSQTTRLPQSEPQAHRGGGGGGPRPGGLRVGASALPSARRSGLGTATVPVPWDRELSGPLCRPEPLPPWLTMHTGRVGPQGLCRHEAELGRGRGSVATLGWAPRPRTAQEGRAVLVSQTDMLAFTLRATRPAGKLRPVGAGQRQDLAKAC